MSHWRATNPRTVGADQPAGSQQLSYAEQHSISTTSGFAQALIDIGTIGFWVLFLSLFFVGSGGSVLIAFFL